MNLPQMKERHAYTIIFTLLIVGTIICMATKYTNEGILILVSAIFVFFYHLYTILNEQPINQENKQ